MNRSRIIRTAALPAAALLVTGAGAALATGDDSPTATSETTEVQDGAVTEDALGAAVSAWLQSEEGQEALAEHAPTAVAQKVAALQEQIDELEADHEDDAATEQAVADLKAQVAALAQELAVDDVAAPTSEKQEDHAKSGEAAANWKQERDAWQDDKSDWQDTRDESRASSNDDVERDEDEGHDGERYDDEHHDGEDHDGEHHDGDRRRHDDDERHGDHG